MKLRYTPYILGLLGILWVSDSIAQQAPAPVAMVAASPAATPPATTVPATTVPAAVTPPVPVVTAPLTATPSTAAAPKPVVDESKIPPEAREMLAAGFGDSLSFPLTEEKLVSFARAGLRVQKINSRWDVEIASAETDQRAIESTNFSVEDINVAIRNIPNLTLPEYNEMTQLTVKNVDFARLVGVYSRLVKEGVFGTLPRSAQIIDGQEKDIYKTPPLVFPIDKQIDQNKISPAALPLTTGATVAPSPTPPVAAKPVTTTPAAANPYAVTGKRELDGVIAPVETLATGAKAP